AASAAKLDGGGVRSALEPMGGIELQPGEWIVGVESGGGGYGDPRTRDPEAVLADVREGWVSARAAREDYAVVLTGSRDGANLAVDPAGTAVLRAAP
ncbi:MAG: hypothetical protein JWQ18_3732, partial [Conexibacter sp.]|nr:hypothetical protein [Conexibacter sp.]